MPRTQKTHSMLHRSCLSSLPKRLLVSTFPLLFSAVILGLTMDAAFAAPGEAGGTTRFDLALLVRIGVAVALAFPIGWEREFRGSEAGDRTFMLVSLGAAAFTAVGV